MSGEKSERFKVLCDEAFDYCQEYMRVNWGPPPPLRLLASRYGKAFRTIGWGLKEALRADGRFSVKMVEKTGGYTVGLIVKPPPGALDGEALKGDMVIERLSRVQAEIKRRGLELNKGNMEVVWGSMFPGDSYPVF